MRNPPSIFVRAPEASTRTPSWLAPHGERDVQSLRWSVAPEPRDSSAPPARTSLPRPSILPSIPAPSPSVEVRMPTPPGIPTFDRGDVDRELAALAATFAEATDALHAELEAHRVALRDACEREAVKLAFVIAARVVGAEVATRPEIALAWAREGAEEILADDPPEIRVGPKLASLLHEAGVVAAVHVDESLGPTAVRVVAGGCRVDAGLGARLRAVFDDVVPEDAP